VSKQDRGFGSMIKTPEGAAKVRRIASKGGRAAHEQGSAHEWTVDEARAAGRKGGLASAAKRRERTKSEPARYRPGRPVPFGGI
jgi:general stress protein YciG